MIRALFLLLLFGLGLAGAGVWYGEMHHLRRAVPDRLPGWTEAFDDRSGMRHGILRHPRGVRPHELVLEWRAASPGGEGLNWDLRLTGRGIELSATALLPWQADRVRISGGRGSVELAPLAVHDDVEGLFLVEDIAGEVVEPLGVQVVEINISGQLRGVEVDGIAMGSGPMAVTIWADGRLEGDIALAGGVAPMKGVIAGDLGTGHADLDLVIQSPDALIEGVRRRLEPLGGTTREGLRVILPLRLIP